MVKFIFIEKCTLYRKECKRAIEECSAEMDCHDCKYMRIIREDIKID